jgi:hypothetical protein
MIKYFCDKCGKELPLFNDEFTSDMFKVTVEPPEVRRWADNAEAGTYILCYDCVRKLNKWINKNDDVVKYAPVPNVETCHIPEACRSCSNHPSNGGSGICNCTLGSVEVKY